MPNSEVVLNPNELSDILAKEAIELSDAEIDKLVAALRAERAEHIAALNAGKAKPRSKIKAAGAPIDPKLLDIGDLLGSAEGEGS